MEIRETNNDTPALWVKPRITAKNAAKNTAKNAANNTAKNAAKNTAKNAAKNTAKNAAKLFALIVCVFLQKRILLAEKGKLKCNNCQKY